jgi:hypothetical protein
MCQHLYQNFYTQFYVAELLCTPIPSHEQRTQHRTPSLLPVRPGNPFKEADGPFELPRCIVRPGNLTGDLQCQSSLTVAIGQRGVLLEKLVRLCV